MNDRYKYRVAVKHGTEWLIYNVINILYKPDGTVWVQVLRQTDTATFTAWFQVDGENVILEQCTGLHDKSSKLIYEGDVVRELFDDGSFMDGVVFYNELQCRWFIKYEFPCAPGDSAYRELNSSKAKGLEIIGNIHEQEVEK